MNMFLNSVNLAKPPRCPCLFLLTNKQTIENELIFEFSLMSSLPKILLPFKNQVEKGHGGWVDLVSKMFSYFGVLRAKSIQAIQSNQTLSRKDEKQMEIFAKQA